MTDLAPYPNVKKALMGLLSDLAKTGTAAPAGESWNGTPPFLRIRVNGGNTVGVHTAARRIDIDTLTNDEVDSDNLAELVMQRILSAPGRRIGDFIFDTTAVDQLPHSVPWGSNTAIFNTTAAYRISARRA